MKTSKHLSTITVFLVSLIIISGCQKELEFGHAQTNFEIGKTYQAEVNGLLTVRYTNNSISNETFVKVFSDFNSEPTILIGEIKNPGTMTIPIRKNDYWKVTKSPSGIVRLSFVLINLN